MKRDKKTIKRYRKRVKKSVKTVQEIPKVTRMVKSKLFLIRYRGSVKERGQKDLFLAYFGPILEGSGLAMVKNVRGGLNEGTWGP